MGSEMCIRDSVIFTFVAVFCFCGFLDLCCRSIFRFLSTQNPFYYAGPYFGVSRFSTVVSLGIIVLTFTGIYSTLFSLCFEPFLGRFGPFFTVAKSGGARVEVA